MFLVCCGHFKMHGGGECFCILVLIFIRRFSGFHLASDHRLTAQHLQVVQQQDSSQAG